MDPRDAVAMALLLVFVVCATLGGFAINVAGGFYSLAGACLVVGVLLATRSE